MISLAEVKLKSFDPRVAMGIFGAMQTAVSGMQAQAYALENISGNIANSQTIGYKRIDTSFQDLVPDLALSSLLTGGVSALSQSTNSLAGSYRSTGVATNIALSGSGYFAVSKKTADATGTLQFSPTPYFTRRGDFRLDVNNNLVNGSGQYLMGYAVDPVSGVVRDGLVGTIQIPTTDLAPAATTAIKYQGNLPTVPTNEAQSKGSLGTSTAGTTIAANGEANFLDQTISGGALTIYDQSGSAMTLQMRWAKTSTGNWDLYYMSDSAATGTQAKWTSLGPSATFNTAGKLTSASPLNATLTIDGKTTGGPIAITLANVSQYGDTNGVFRQSSISQDGHSSASLTGMEIGSQGRVYAKYSNGMQVPVADIAIAHFNGEEALKRGDGGAYEVSDQSGEPIYGMNGSSIMVGGVEGSNADISQEFTRMIATQQAYSANAKVISTAQEMMTEAVNVIR